MSKAHSLVTKARTAQPLRNSPPNREVAELSVAWATGEVSYTQVHMALDRTKRTTIYNVLACGLRDAVRLGMLKKGNL